MMALAVNVNDFLFAGFTVGRRKTREPADHREPPIKSVE